MPQSEWQECPRILEEKKRDEERISRKQFLCSKHAYRLWRCALNGELVFQTLSLRKERRKEKG